jgi:hypothetical protein
MAYKYQVKSFVWIDGNVQTKVQEFDDENSAILHARYLTPAETVKVYVEDVLIFSQDAPTTSPDSYA